MKTAWSSRIDDLVHAINGAPDVDQQALANLKVWIGSSKTNTEFISVASVLSELFKAHGATVLPEAPLPVHIYHELVQEQLRGVDLIAMLAATPGVSAEALVICATAPHNADKMIVYMPQEFREGFIYDVLTRKYKAEVRTFDLSKLAIEKDACLCEAFFVDALEKVNEKKLKAKLTPHYSPRIGIVTALPEERKAVMQILSDIRNERSREDGDSLKEYVHGTIASDRGGKHQVVLALAGKGNNKAAIIATQMLNDFKSVEEVFMVGIAAGVPTPKKAATHVRLGDVVISDETGVIQYDMVKVKRSGVDHTHPPRPPDPDWTKRLKHYLAEEHSGEQRYWRYIDEICAALNIRRPSSAPLRECPWVEKGTCIPHPSDPHRTRGRPKLYEGPIGSANIVLKKANVRDRLRKTFGIRAIEMEGSGIADATWEHGKGYIIVRGICDYANDSKNDVWHDYAAVVAAAFTRDLIETMPVRTAGSGN